MAIFVVDIACIINKNKDNIKNCQKKDDLCTVQ